MNIIAQYVSTLVDLCVASVDPAARDRCCASMYETFESLKAAVEEGHVSPEALALGVSDVNGKLQMRKIIQSPNFRYAVMCHDPTNAFSGLDFVVYASDGAARQRYSICPPLA